MLSNRRRALMIAGLAVVLYAIVLTVWNPFMEKHRRARMQAKQAELRLVQVLDLRDRIVEDRAARESLEKIVRARGRDFDLYTYVNERVKKQRAQKNVKLTSKGTTSSGRAMQAVSVEFKDVPIKVLLDVVHNFYYGRNLVVLDRLHHLRPARSGQGIDCEITLVSPR